MLNQSKSAFIGVLLAFLALGTLYSLATPLFEASDEIWHYPFVAHLASGGELPVNDPASPALWRQEGSQPPLYYAFVALFISWIDTSDLSKILCPNPHADIGVLRPGGNVNMVLHTPAEEFPWRGAALAAHIARLLSVLMGAGTVLLTYLIALEVFPGQEALAAGAAAFNAFIPMFLFISASVNNDNLVVPLCSLSLLLLLRLVGERPDAPFPARRLVLLGVVFGLAALAKASALALFPMAGLALGWAGWRRRSLGFFLKGGVIVLSLAGLIAGWWYLRNFWLYGDPLGLNVFLAVVGPRHPPPSLAQLFSEWGGFIMSFWGLFGGLNVLAEPFVYWILNGMAALGVLGLILGLGKALRAGQAVNFKIVLLALWPLVIFIALLRWTYLTKASQGRLMFPAISAISALLIWGLSQYVPGKWKWAWLGFIGLATFALAALTPFISIAPAYARPALVSQAELGEIPHQLNVSFSGKIELLGYAAEEERARPGGSLEVKLYWCAQDEMERDYSFFVHLLGEHDLVLAQRDSYPGRGLFPTSQWHAGGCLADTYILALPPTIYTPDTACFEVGVYDFETGRRLPAVSLEDEPLGDEIRFHRITIEPRPGGNIPNPRRFTFEGRIALIGYDLDRRAAHPGEEVLLTLYWQGLRQMEEDYTVFTHLVDEKGRLWAQKDGQPQGGASPTSTWQPGQVFADEYKLHLRPDAPPGVCQIEIGLYDRNGQRLRVRDEEDLAESDKVLLSKVRVLP